MRIPRWLAAAALVSLAWELSSLSPGLRHPPPSAIRDTAIRRGLQFIYAAASDPANFAEYGADYLWCFYCVASTSSDVELSRRAGTMGRERARHWRAAHPSVPPDASPDAIAELVFGSQAADGLGIRDDNIRQELARAARRYRPEQFLDFNPREEPPPSDLPERCGKCGKFNARGIRVCPRCGSALTMRSPFDVLEEALVVTYSGDCYGVFLGGNLEDVTQWVPQLRPYRGRDGGKNEEWPDTTYAITHLVYTLNGYSRFRLRPEWLPAEFDFLHTNISEAIGAGDTETAGEFLDTLKSFGLNEADSPVRAAIEFILARQNSDGSWGDPRARDIYSRYHPTWTAIDGLRDYAWHGEGVTSPEALRRARGNRAELR